jgi:hypothetical protein
MYPDQHDKPGPYSSKPPAPVAAPERVPTQAFRANALLGDLYRVLREMNQTGNRIKTLTHEMTDRPDPGLDPDLPNAMSAIYGVLVAADAGLNALGVR